MGCSYGSVQPRVCQPERKAQRPEKPDGTKRDERTAESAETAQGEGAYRSGTSIITITSSATKYLGDRTTVSKAEEQVAKERSHYEAFRDSLAQKRSITEYLIDAEWFDSWVHYLIHGYPSQLWTVCRAQRPHTNINWALNKERKASMRIKLETRNKRLYLIDAQLWNFLENTYGSQLLLKCDARSRFISAYYRCSQDKGRSEVNITNRDELENIQILPIRFESYALEPVLPSCSGNGKASLLIDSGQRLTTPKPPVKSYPKAPDSLPAVQVQPRSCKVDIIDSTADKSNISGGLAPSPLAVGTTPKTGVDYIGELMERRHAPAVGMKNSGANCYLNAGLQCLFCVPEVNAYFLAEKYTSIRHKTKKAERVVCRELTLLLDEMFAAKQDVVSPRAFIGMSPPGQQDADEFLWKRLFPSVQDETNPADKVERREGWSSEESWEWYRRYNTSILDSLFGGQYRGTVKCKSCGYVSVTYDPFLGMSLPLTGDTIESCLSNEYEREELSKKVGYKCEKCSEVSAVTKLMEVDRSPQYLMIHLKRLVGGSKKLAQYIEYPRELDITKHCVNKAKESLYGLIAVCVHNGGAHSGHFYCYGKRGNNWYLFNDESVRQVKEDNALDCEAYMLFYSRIDSC